MPCEGRRNIGIQELILYKPLDFDVFFTPCTYT